MNSFYYTPDKKTFNSKIDALAYAKKTGQKASLYYYDDMFDRYDWTIEPPGTLDFYYVEQAKRLRDEYDYLILAYSGGVDSTNILETFHYNNIKLDKILMVGAFSQDTMENSDENHNGELYKNCFPYVKDLGLESIAQVIDYTKFFDKFKEFSVYQQYGDEWTNYIGSYFSVHTWFWNDIEKYVVPPGYENKRVGIIFGKDKPFIIQENNKIGFRFTDKALFAYASSPHKEKNNVDRINFYWDPEFPLILIKQLHLLRQHNWVINCWTEEPIGHFIYNLRRPLIYKSPKSVSPILSLRDMYLVKHKSSELFDFYGAGIRKLNDKIGIDNIETIGTKFYSIT